MCSIFADDTTAYTIGFDLQTRAKVLSSDLDHAYEWASTWGILLNAQKSNHLTISTAAVLPEGGDAIQRVSMNGVVVLPFTEHKHLGVIIYN